MSEHHCCSFTKLNELFCVIQLNLIWNNRLDWYPSKVNHKMLPNFMQRVCLHTIVHFFWFSALNLSSCFYSTMHPHHCQSCKMHLKLRFCNQYKKSWNMICCFFCFSATWGQQAWYEMCLCLTGKTLEADTAQIVKTTHGNIETKTRTDQRFLSMSALI